MKTNNDLDAILETVVRQVKESVRRNPAEGLLLSGGLDTSILAHVVSKWAKPVCFTVALKDAPAPDIAYAEKIASRLGLKHYIHYFGDEELEAGLRGAIRVIRSFDPMEIRNSAAVYVALQLAKKHGINTVMTGDAGDELFAGYSFYFGLSKEQLDSELAVMWQCMRFSSTPLAHDLGMTARIPFLDSEFKDFAMKMDSGLKVRSENGQFFGKWVLRKAFEKIISPEVAWRVKAPIEVGTGTTTLPARFAARISDAEFREKQKIVDKNDGVRLRDKEQLHYYEIYRDLFGAPGAGTAATGKKCPDCGSNIADKGKYCPTCGAYPV